MSFVLADLPPADKLAKQMMDELKAGLLEQALATLIPDLKDRISILIEAQRPALQVWAEAQRQQLILNVIFNPGGKR